MKYGIEPLIRQQLRDGLITEFSNTLDLVLGKPPLCAAIAPVIGEELKRQLNEGRIENFLSTFDIVGDEPAFLTTLSQGIGAGMRELVACRRVDEFITTLRAIRNNPEISTALSKEIAQGIGEQILRYSDTSGKSSRILPATLSAIKYSFELREKVPQAITTNLISLLQIPGDSDFEHSSTNPWDKVRHALKAIQEISSESWPLYKKVCELGAAEGYFFTPYGVLKVDASSMSLRPTGPEAPQKGNFEIIFKRIQSNLDYPWPPNTLIDLLKDAADQSNTPQFIENGIRNRILEAKRRAENWQHEPQMPGEPSMVGHRSWWKNQL